MKIILMLLLMQGALRAEDAPQALSPAAAIDSAAETFFQEARRAYLAGDRDSAWRALNQALSQDPFHTGAGRLYQTLKEEEKTLRQLKLAQPSPVPTAQGAPSKDGVRAQPAGDGGEGAHARLWTAIKSLESRLNQKMSGLEQSVQNVEGSLNTVRAEAEGQRQVGSMLGDSQKRLERRQDYMLLGLFGMCVLMILVLLWLVRNVANARGEVERMETVLSDPIWRRKK